MRFTCSHDVFNPHHLQLLTPACAAWLPVHACRPAVCGPRALLLCCLPSQLRCVHGWQGGLNGLGWRLVGAGELGSLAPSDPPHPTCRRRTCATRWRTRRCTSQSTISFAGPLPLPLCLPLPGPPAGFIPRTYCPDHDPLDVLVLMQVGAAVRADQVVGSVCVWGAVLELALVGVSGDDGGGGVRGLCRGGGVLCSCGWVLAGAGCLKALGRQLAQLPPLPLLGAAA
jgi:hypothetical protein